MTNGLKKRVTSALMRLERDAIPTLTLLFTDQREDATWRMCPEPSTERDVPPTDHDACAAHCKIAQQNWLEARGSGSAGEPPDEFNLLGSVANKPPVLSTLPDQEVEQGICLGVPFCGDTIQDL